MRAGGYTLIELVSVMVIAGILAAFALPRFADLEPFAARGYFEETLSALRYAHKLALASGCSVRVEITSAPARVGLARYGGADCTQPIGPTVAVARPGSADPFALAAPDGVAIERDLTFYFDRIGRPRSTAGILIDDAQALTLGIGGHRLQIVPDTGLVREL